jgi:hypothetical protein
VHGALLIDATFEESTIDGESTIDPVITLPTNEWEQDISESTLLPPNYWPGELATVNTQVTTNGDLVQTLVIIPAQFRPTGEDQYGNLVGTQRLFRSLSFELLRSDPQEDSQEDDDWQPPKINGVDMSPSGDNVRVTVNASDPSGIEQVFVFRINGELERFECLQDVNGDWFVDVPWTTGDKLMIQVVDGPGNVATYTGKGANLSSITVDAGPDQGFEPGEEIEFTATLDFGSLVKPVFYTLDFGDGTPAASGEVTGNTLTKSHEYTGDPPQAIAKLKVTDSDGGIGVDTVRVTVKTVPTVSIESSINPSIIGELVTFTVNVAADMSLEWPVWIPTLEEGTVTFYHDGIEFDDILVTEVSEGVAIAIVDISSLEPGWHEITATYNGNDFFLSSEPGGMDEPQKVVYRFEGFNSPIDGSQYIIGRVIPVKFLLTDYNGNSIGTATAEIRAQVSEQKPNEVAPSVDDYSFGNAVYQGDADKYQNNIDTSLLQDANPDDWLTIIVSLDDGNFHWVSIQLK